MNDSKKIYLNIGSGNNKLPGFINVDIEPGADVVADVTRGLPFNSNSVDGIYSEHFIEHLSQAEGCFFFRECRRILKPGATMRVATPDLDEIIASFTKAGFDSAGNPAGWLHPDWFRFGFEWISTRAEMLNTAMREWGHKWLYNEEEMVRLAVFCGLSGANRCELGKSGTPEFCNLEHRDGSGLILEFTKQKRVAFGGKPLVSVCIPAYKPTYFKAALDSLVAQTYSNLEIIVSDDARDSGIYDVVLPYLSDTRFRYIKNPVHGGDENYINALNHATGPYVKYFNDDDLMTPDCIEQLVVAAESFPEAVLVTSARRQFSGNMELQPPAGGFLPPVQHDSLIDGMHAMAMLVASQINFVGEPNCTLFRKADIEGVKPHLLTMGGQKNVWGSPGDVVMWLNLLSKGDLVFLTPVLSYLRSNPQQIQRMDDYQTKGIAAWSRMVQQAVRLGMDRQSTGVQRPVLPISPAEIIENSGVAFEIHSLIEAGDLARATSLLQPMMSGPVVSDIAWALLGDLFVKTGRLSDALETWNTGVLKCPESRLLRSRLIHFT